ncbi:hypothetical protein [Companilactobacillus alimentarius]|uniref:hypothetical protein n=1 Tax=Companilactobacillus alimentarius TaxID=1602 RepID=UPI0011BF6E74|nr:hypothetical protein [Companilactobacillus alimentarius]
MPIQKIGADVTEARWRFETTDERLYLSIFIDFYSGEILSYSTSLHPNTDFIIESLLSVLKMTKDTGYLSTMHSDQGIQRSIS